MRIQDGRLEEDRPGRIRQDHAVSVLLPTQPEGEPDEPAFVADPGVGAGHEEPAGPLRGISLRNQPIAVQLGAIVVAFGIVVVLLVALMAGSNRLTTAGRTYMEGDRLWTHAQDQAIYSLALYISSGEERDYRAFSEHLEVPLALRVAREELGKPSLRRSHQIRVKGAGNRQLASPDPHLCAPAYGPLDARPRTRDDGLVRRVHVRQRDLRIGEQLVIIAVRLRDAKFLRLPLC